LRAAAAAWWLFALALPGKLLAAEVERDGQRWTCESLDAGNECIGKTTVTDADGRQFSSTRVDIGGGRIRWTGPMTETFPDGSHRRCASTSPTKGLCIGTVIDSGADGGMVAGTRQIRDGRSVWVGTLETRFASGNRERCEAASLETALCNGLTEFTWANGNRRNGIKQVVDDREVWIGPVVETLVDGRELHCAVVTANGSCDGDARWLLTDGSERLTRFVDGREQQNDAVPTADPTGH